MAHPSLSQLDVSCNGITDLGICRLAEGLRACTSLTRLELWGNYCTESGLRPLLEAGHNQLQWLDVGSSVGIGSSFLSSLLMFILSFNDRLLSSCSSSWNLLDCGCVRMVCNFVMSLCLVGGCTDNHLKSESGAVLGNFLQQNSALRVLRLSSCDLPHCPLPICEHPHIVTLTFSAMILSFAGNSLEESGAFDMFDLLQVGSRTCALEELHLCSCVQLTPWSHTLWAYSVGIDFYFRLVGVLVRVSAQEILFALAVLSPCPSISGAVSVTFEFYIYQVESPVHIGVSDPCLECVSMNFEHVCLAERERERLCVYFVFIIAETQKLSLPSSMCRQSRRRRWWRNVGRCLAEKQNVGRIVPVM